MKIKATLLAVGALMTACPGALLAQNQSVPFHAQVWLGGMNPARHNREFPNDPPSDYFSMFSPDAQWKATAPGIAVFKMPPALIAEGKEDDLRKVFQGLKARHIALAIEGGWLVGDAAGGRGPTKLEAFGVPGISAYMAKRVKRLGGDLKYIVMDEPLYWGHTYSGKNAVQLSIPEVARGLAAGVREWRAEFPQVQIGDGEPIGGVDPEWSERFIKFAKAYERATGTPLAFFHADVYWKGPWQQELPKVVRTVRGLHIPMGIIYNGGPANTTEEWTANAAKRFMAIENNPATCPDQAVFVSWERFPTNMMPEHKPGTSTNLVLHYLRKK